ncbi:MAG: RNA 3'-terminal phosphate cyclase [Acidobacteriota bacterium]
MRLPVDIDGSRGEGGGQILRTSLALALITGRKLRMKHIRARRKHPGLQRQHLACVHAAARLAATTAGELTVGAASFELAPQPREAWAEHLEIDIGTAGSTTLVVQTLLVPAIVSGRPLHAVITGGTHNPLAPPFPFLDRVFLPHLRAMGADVTLTLDKIGVMPEGGGRIVLDVRPGGKLRPLELVAAGNVVARRATAICARLPRHVGERELAVARERLNEPACNLIELPDDGPHNVFMVEVELASGARELVTSHGRKGYPAEDVADDALDDLEDFLEAGVPVGEHLADQLLLPMAVAGGGRFRTLAPLSSHAETNLATIREFLDVPIRIESAGAMACDVIVG